MDSEARVVCLSFGSLFGFCLFLDPLKHNQINLCN